VILKRYAHIFENKNEGEFLQQMSEIRVRIPLEIQNITK
jgi:hypothetical protein